MGEIMVKIRAAPMIIGIILSTALAILFKMIAGVWGEYMGLLLATIYVGYSISGEYKNGAVYGLLVGIIGGIIVGILTIMGFKVLLVAAGTAAGPDILIELIIIWAVIGAIGGTIGVIIKGLGSSEEKHVV